MNVITYTVKYKGPTDSNGSRWVVRNTVSGVRRTVPYNYAASGSMALDAVTRAFPGDAASATLVWSGSDSARGEYVTAVRGV